MHVTSVERSAHLVQRHPSPSEVHISHVAVLADAGNRDEFSTCGDNAEPLAGIVAANQVAKRLHPDGSEDNLPARWRSYFSNAIRRRAFDPAALLENKVFRGKIVFIGDETGAEPKLLHRLEIFRATDEVGCQTASEDIARGTGDAPQ